jgi:hypothetical protein
MSEQKQIVETKEPLPSIFNELPQLEFSLEGRETAIERIEEIQRKPIDNEAEIIGLIIRHGLFERYYEIADELADPRKMQTVIKTLSSDESGVVDHERKANWIEIYWNHVEYPAVANLILRDKISEIDGEKLIKQSVDRRFTPFDRMTTLYDIVLCYKTASDKNKNRIRKRLRESIGDYPERVLLGKKRATQNNA